MKCFNCKKEYKDELFSCPYCGTVNKAIYKDIKERDLKISVVEKLEEDIRKNKFKIKKELPIVLLSIIIGIIGYTLNYYYFNYIENYPFLYELLTNYSFLLIIFIPISLFIYYKKVSLFSLIITIYFSIITCMGILFPFFYLLVFGEGYKIYIAIFLTPIIIILILFGLKIVIRFIKNKLLDHHIITILLLMNTTLYLLVIVTTIIIRITCY